MKNGKRKDLNVHDLWYFGLFNKYLFFELSNKVDKILKTLLEWGITVIGVVSEWNFNIYFKNIYNQKKIL